MKKYGLSIFVFLSAILLSVMEDATALAVEPTQLYVIPGQNGSGCEDWHVGRIFGATDIAVPIPSSIPDLGQERCLSYLRNVLNAHPEHRNLIVYAVSQGTATVLNYLAETSDQRIKCVVLQAPLVSGNSAILHTLKGPLMNYPGLANLPFAHYWIPYCAKVLFPLYWPAGRQPIKSIQKISRDIPIVIVHSKDDPQLPYEGACALYYGLRSQGKNNVYFISKDSGGHMWLLNENDKPAIDAILAKHDLKEQSPETAAIDLSIYQPDHMQFKAYYDDLIFKESNHTCLKYTAIATCATIAARVLRSKIAPVLNKVVPIVCKTCSGVLNSTCAALGIS